MFVIFFIESKKEKKIRNYQQKFNVQNENETTKKKSNKKQTRLAFGTKRKTQKKNLKLTSSYPIYHVCMSYKINESKNWMYPTHTHTHTDIAPT